MLYKARMRCTEFLSGRYSVNDRGRVYIMTKVENGYFMSDEEHSLMLEKFEKIETGLNKLSEMLEKMAKSLEDTQRGIDELEKGYDRMNACMDRIESNMQ